MVNVVLSLGCNLGDKYSLIEKMEHSLGLYLDIFKKSTLMETEPVGVENQPWFLNRVILGAYDGTPTELLSNCLMVEKKLGRTEKGLLKARTADIDILLYDAEIVKTDILTIPHPAIKLRRFCLEGMNELVKDWFIPGENRTVRELFDEMGENVKSQKIRFLKG